MTVYREIVWADRGDNNTFLKEADTLTHVPGGIELTFASSPSTTTFYPYQQIRHIQIIDTEKGLRRSTEEDDKYDDTML